MSQPVNLNKFRKARAKSEKAKTARANSARFGQSKSKRDTHTAKTTRDAKHLDAHRLDD